jgi:excisionase family DNA binding protein
MNADNQAILPTPNVFVTKPEMAARLKVQVRTVDNWMRRGILPYIKIGSSVRFHIADVDEHLRKNNRVAR